MNPWVLKAMLGSVLALGLGFAPAIAQGGGDDHERAKEKPARSVAKCPITNEPVNLAVSARTDSGPVYFCCKDCVPKFQADPAKYDAKVAAQRSALASRPRIQVTCPVSQEPVDQEFFVEDAGAKVYFCCKGCVKKYQRAPAKYKSALANAFTYQTKCPVMNEEIDPQAHTTLASGRSIYFCCKGCDKKFFVDPLKYASGLIAQGYTYNSGAMKHGE